MAETAKDDQYRNHGHAAATFGQERRNKMTVTNVFGNKGRF
jgi:hypothetical protein